MRGGAAMREPAWELDVTRRTIMNDIPASGHLHQFFNLHHVLQKTETKYFHI